MPAPATLPASAAPWRSWWAVRHTPPTGLSVRSLSALPVTRRCRWSSSHSGSADVPAVHRQRHVDVAPGGIGVRAHLMGGSNDPRRLLRILNPRQGYVELHGELETTLLGGQQAHTAVDRDITHLGALTTADHAQGTLEAGRIAHSEELFRVRAAALAAHLLRRAELHIQGSIIRAPVTSCPAACDRCLRHVKHSRHFGLRCRDLQIDRLTSVSLQYLLLIAAVNRGAAHAAVQLVGISRCSWLGGVRTRAGRTVSCFWRKRWPRSAHGSRAWSAMLVW